MIGKNCKLAAKLAGPHGWSTGYTKDVLKHGLDQGRNRAAAHDFRASGRVQSGRSKGLGGYLRKRKKEGC